MNPIRKFHAEAKRIVRDVFAVHAKHRPSIRRDEFDAEEFDADLIQAFGQNNGRDLKAEAMRAAPSEIVAKRIETVQTALAELA